MEKKHDSENNGILIPYILGNEYDWENHYRNLLHYFKDDRYIKIDNKPIFVILQYDENLEKMCNHWNSLAQKDGFKGMFFIFKNKRWYNWGKNAFRFNYEPHFDGWENPTTWERRVSKLKKPFHLPRNENYYNYDVIWKKIIGNAEKSSHNEFLGAFVGFDDSPRRSTKGRIVKGASPEKFMKYLSKLMTISEKQGKEFVFITAWNEWGEGAFLEPDCIHRYEYLNVISKLTGNNI